MFGFVGVVSRTEQDLPAFSGSSIQFEKFKFHSKFKIFPEKEDGQTFSCSDGAIVKILGLFFAASKTSSAKPLCKTQVINLTSVR